MTESVEELRAGGKADGLAAGFEEAVRAAGEAVEHQYGLAGAQVRMRFAGHALERKVHPAFAHLEGTLREEPEVTLSLWDSASTRTPRPELAPVRAPRGEVVGEPDPIGPGPSYSSVDDELQVLHQPIPDILSALSAAADKGWFWTADAARFPHWDAAAPFRHLLSWWLGTRGCQQVHGGAVGTPSGGVLLVGRGGSGKSTIALASLLDPRLRYAGDDYVAVGGDDEPWIYSLYSSGKLHAGHLERLPHMRAMVSNADRLDREKAVVFVHDHLPERTTSGFPLRAVVLPRITDTIRPRITETSRAAALAALAPSTIFQLHPPERVALARMARLVGQVPAFGLEIGSDIPSIPDALVELLEAA